MASGSDGRKPGLEFAVGRRDDDNENGSGASLGVYKGVGGHSGFVGSRMGLEMLGRADPEPWDDFEDGPFLPLIIVSVSLVHEKDRDVLVTGTAALSGELGGV